MVSLSITGLAATVLLLGAHSSLQTTSEAVEQTIAAGIAEQLIDEVLGHPYMHPGTTPYQYPLIGSSWERQGAGRERFNDTDDFNGYRSEPVEDTWGVEMGRGDDQGGYRHAALQIRSGYFENWREEIDVYYVDEDDPSVRLPAGQTSNFRAVEVRVYHRNSDGSLRPLVELRRVYAYVPPPQ